LLLFSAELGFAFAQALMASQARGDERFKFAQLAAAQGERDGFLWLGWCFRDGEGCEEDLDNVWAMNELGDLLDESDPQRWRWWGRAAALGDRSNFLFSFPEQVELFNSGS
jgi:TPR repeat protein